MLTEADTQELNEESRELMSKIKEIADAQSLSASSLNMNTPQSEALAPDFSHIEQSATPTHLPQPLESETVIGPYGGSRILSWAEMRVLDRSRRQTEITPPKEVQFLPQTLAELREWDPHYKPSSVPHGARATQKRRLRRLKRIRDYYAAH